MAFTKSEFLPRLKKVVEVLEQESITYEIPFVHVDQQLFHYATIIITENITAFDLNKMFHLSTITEKDNVVYTTFEGLPVNFVRTMPDLWGYTFLYCCWNVLPVLIDALVKPLNLHYTRYGLKYQFDKHQLVITNNLQHIMEFLELPFHMLVNGFPTEYTIFSFAESCPYCDRYSFSLAKFQALDPMYEQNKLYYESFLDHCPPMKGSTLELEEQIELIDAYFPKAKLLEKLARLELVASLPEGVKIVSNTKSRFKVAPTMEELIQEKSEEVKAAHQKRKINLKEKFKLDKANSTPEEQRRLYKGLFGDPESYEIPL